MAKRSQYHDHPCPEHQRWARTYPRFPGIEECTRLILSGKAKGVWAELIVYELAENAETHLNEIIQMYDKHKPGDVAMYMMMALEIAQAPGSVDFLAHVLLEGDEQMKSYAQQALKRIDTRASRTALHHAKNQ